MPRISRRCLPVETVSLTRYLIGKHLVHRSPAGRIAGRIVETEACPPGDPTGYTRPGLTTSNAPLLVARGTACVRMVYGACLSTRIGLSRDQRRRPRFVERGSPFVSVPP